MRREFNLTEELRSPEVQQFEKNMSNHYGRQVALRDVPLKNFVDVSSGLLETKIASTFLKGATDEAGFWQSLINVVQMTSPKQDVPIVSQRDFKVRTGRISKAALEESGGSFRYVELDTTDDDKTRYVYLEIDGSDIRLRNFNVVEQAIQAAGAAFAKNILGDVIKHYIDHAGNEQALSSDKRFVAVMKAIAKNKTDGFGCSAIVVHYDDFVDAITEETTGGTMPWLMSLSGSAPPLGSNFSQGYGKLDGFVGNLFGKIPVFAVSNDSNLSGNIVCVDVAAAAMLGFGPAGGISLAQEVRKIDDLVANAISATYDIKSHDDDGSGNTNAVAVVTGA
jgi:hypothetical protein